VTARVRVVSDPPADLLSVIERFEPDNPIQRAAYARSRQLLGERVCAIIVEDGGQPSAGCFAYLSGRRLAPVLTIASMPVVTDVEGLLRAVRRWCRRHAVWELHIETFCSAITHVPRLPGEFARRERCEWMWALPEDPSTSLSSHHRRNVAKARKSGVELRRSREPADAASHARLVAESMARRAQRGEAVPDVDGTLEWESVLRVGVGELFQGILGGEVVTSLLVLRSGSVAYYMSAGTSPVGFSSGAAPFVVLSAAQALGGEGVRTFNLAGAGDEAPGLQRYKRDFGAEPRRLDAATAHVLPVAFTKARTAARLLLRDPRALAAQLVSRERLLVYGAAIDELADGQDDLICSRLTDEELAALRGSADFAAQARRFDEFRLNAAYAVNVDGRLAHVAWMLTRDEASLAGAARHLPLDDASVEITHCHTAEAFRGRGIYPRAIRALAAIARERGAERVYMATGADNVASQRGIEKAGLRRSGEIVRYRVPFLGGRTLFVRRSGDIGGTGPRNG
jgi:RimJ/RimL family protein N-acetyltransferase